MTTQDKPNHQRRPARRLLTVALCCLAPSLLAACSSAPRAADEPAQPRNEWSYSEPSGSSAELVFSGQAIQSSEWFIASEGSSLALRNDARLGALEPSSATSQLAYPEERASSLDRLRTIYISPNPDRIQYYGRDRRRHW